ncbi:MAG TPA: serine/threonine-protein kinase [Kofleriaceae bacterium]|nr:serine/threonine-protein kinase [Kofleriaceae bacterium]
MKQAGLDHTASMSPDERARRRLTPPSGSPSGSGERPALAVAADTPAHTEPSVQPDSTLSAAAAGLPRGDTARYQLEGVHARGGLGRVVKAHDQQLHRTVAIKELLKRSPSAEARFVREALITARLQHPGVVPVHEAGRWPSGDPYYSMKLVSGRTLKELIGSRRSLEERVALVPHVLAVAEAIAYAHSQKVIHRDIKPANVIVGDFGETVVVDWGLAKDLSGALPEEDVTAESSRPDLSTAGSAESTALGKVMGTPSYMSPEQARGQELDERADVYSLGALLYEVLSGDAPFTGDTADAILQRALEAAPRPIHEVQPAAPPDLVAIVTKAMSRFPEDRYPTAVELAEDIRRFQTGQLVTARHYSTRSLVKRWIERHRAVVGVAGAAAVALALTAAYAFHNVVDQRNLARREGAAAQRARAAAEERSHELAFQQAQSSLARDPTATLAWLKTLPATGKHAAALPALLDEATALGVSRHVLRHPTWVMGVDYVADGFAVSTDMDGGVYRWDLSTGQGWEIGRHEDGAWMTLLSPDRRLLAIGGKGGSIGLISTSGGAAVRVLGGHRDMIEHMEFSRDGSRLLSWGKDQGLRVWDVASGTPLLALPDGVATGSITPDGDAAIVSFIPGDLVRIEIDGHEGGGARRELGHFEPPVHRTAISPAGDHLLAHALDGTIRMIDLPSGRTRVFGKQDGLLGWAGFSPSGARAATGGIDGTIRLFTVAAEKGDEKTLRGHEDSIYHFEFSPDESILASASDDGTVRVWNLATGEVRVLRGHEDDVYRVAFRADGREIVTSGLDSTARVWPLEFADGRVFVPAPGETYGLRFSDDSKRLFTFGKGKLLTWDATTGVRTVRAEVAADVLARAEKSKMMDPAVDESGDLVATADEAGLVHLWSVLDGAHRELRGHTGKLRALAMAPDGGSLVSADRTGLVLAWDLRGVPDGQAPTSRVLFRDRVVTTAALSHDGTRLVLAAEGNLELFDVASGRSLGEADLRSAGLRGHRPMWIMWSPDGRMIASPGMGADSALWDLDTGRVRRVPHSGHHVVWMMFSPDSKTLAVSQSDRTVRLWDVARWTTVKLEGHRDLVMRIAYHPDSRVLATGSYDKTVRLWDPATGQTLRVLRGHTASVDAVAFAPDGARLASAGRDGTLRVWDLDALPPNDAQAVQARLASATSALIDGGRATTPTGLTKTAGRRR